MRAADTHGSDQVPGPGGLIRAYRLTAGLSQLELAERAGVSLGMIRDLEQGRTRRPHPRLLTRLAEALRLDGAQAARLAGEPADIDPVPGAPDGHEGLWLRVLGPLAGWRDGVPLPLGQPRQRAVLGLLLLGAGGSVHRSELVDGVWGDEPPEAAVNLVQAYVGRLRQVLDPGRAPRDPRGRLVSTGRAYRLRVSPDELDWLRFTKLAARAGATDDPAGAACLYEQALALWQGEPLADVDELRGGTAVTAVRRAWTEAVTGYGRASVEAGRAGQALPYLWTLAERDPLNEKAHALLMTALAGDGQPAAALRVFGEVRDRLDAELGMPPGAELTEAHLRILRRQPTTPPTQTTQTTQTTPTAPTAQTAPTATTAQTTPTAAPPAPVETAEPAPATPPARQLPSAVRGFVGRTDELKALTGLLDELDAGGGTVVISAIGGAAGIGKTALAVHWSHSVAERFPDGQLYVNLRGFDPAAPPLSTAEAVRGFLDALQVPAERVPMGVEAQAALYRGLLAGRRVLVLLDNARDSAQVRPLLPASSTCLVLVTSRRQLTSLTATEGAYQITIDLLNASDAKQLLTARLGPARVAAEGTAVDELLARCAGLPLALSIAAARCAARPDFPIEALLGQLRDARQQLDTLSGGDAASDLRTLFWTSYQQLRPAAARLFRLLGGYPGPDISRPVAASLAGIEPGEAGRALDELTAAYLLDEREPGRYSQHDLLRTYAAELAGRYDSADDLRAATDRVFSHYHHSLDAIDRLRYPDCRPILSPPPMPDAWPEQFTDPDAALSWCQAERRVLAALLGQAAEAGPERYSAGTHWTLWMYFHLWSHWHDLAEARRVVLTATRLVEAGGAAMAEPFAWSGSDDQARDRYRHLVELGQGRGERTARAYCLFGLTQMLARQGRQAEAMAFAEHALGWFRAVDDHAGTALALYQIGRYQIWRGDLGAAVDCCRQALELSGQLGDRLGEAAAADSLGLASYLLGDHAAAVSWCEQAAGRYEQLGDRDGRMEALIHLGDAYHARGDDGPAAASWRAARSLADPEHPNAAELDARLAR